MTTPGRRPWRSCSPPWARAFVNEASWHAAGMGIVLDALSVTVNMSFDAQGFFQNLDQTDTFSKICCVVLESKVIVG